MSSGSWTERVLMVPVREVGGMVRGLVDAIAADPVAAIVFGLLVLLAPRVWKVSKAAARRIDRHLPVRRAPLPDDEVFDEFDRIVERFHAQFCADEPTQELPGVAHLGPATPPPAHVVRRRRVAGVRIPRIPGRRIVRRHFTSSSSDRRPR